MISFKELLGNHSIIDVPIAIQHNMENLLKAINIIREAYGHPMTVTSGYRTEVDMARIYNGKPWPKGSAHLSGLAVDIADSTGALQQWLKGDPKGITSLEKTGLYCEEGTNGWTHFQLRAPKSGKRWFNP